MPIYKLPDEVICLIAQNLIADDSVLHQNLDDLRNVRLISRRFNGLGVRYLFRRITFSLDPSTWARALAISKRPLIAQSVHTIVYSATYYDPEFRSLEGYAKHINNMLKSSQARSTDEAMLLSGLECYPDEALRRGYRRYSFKLGIQSQISTRDDNFESALDFKMLMRVMKRLPHVREFIIDRPSFSAPMTAMCRLPEPDTGPQYIAPTSASRREFRWKIHSPNDSDRMAVELLPADDVPRNLLHLRWSLIEMEMPELLDTRFSDRRSRLKFRALQVIDQTSRLLDLKFTRAGIVLDEGLPHVVRSDRVEVPCFPGWPSPPSSLRTLHLSLLCTLEQEAESLLRGNLARVVMQSPHLTEICITVVYELGALGAKRGNFIGITPACGWLVPLACIFGDQMIPCLKSLSIDGLTSSREDLISFLTRQKDTLRVFKVSGLAAYCPADEEQDEVSILRIASRLEDCAPALNAMQTSGLRLDELVVRARTTGNDGYFSRFKNELHIGPIVDVEDMQDLEKHRFSDVVARFRGEALIHELMSTFTAIES